MSVEDDFHPIRVGVVGASPSRGWATTAHLPALTQLSEFEIVAVSTTRMESARAAAEIYGARHAFDNAEELVAHPDVDLVVVTVKVPSHDTIIRAALEAGKHVVSEWPLAIDLAEATELTELARVAGKVHSIGLQGMHHAGARFVADVIAAGQIGELRSVGMIASAGGGLGSARVSQQQAWARQLAAGATVLTVTGGHVFSTLATALGASFEAVSAVVANLDPTSTIIETNQAISSDVPSQVGVLGTLAGGAVVSVLLQGGRPAGDAGFLLQIAGTEGALRIEPQLSGRRDFHIADWVITLLPATGEPRELAVPEDYRTVPATVPPGAPTNIAALYQEIAAAIHARRSARPSFDTALEYHRLLETINTASATGQIQRTANSASFRG